ncbi:zinc finger MYM-type protein 1-like [Manihot esculenta]|uniref:TTF-type domain-containing protein n=1 Tax=Manihot esculenta TaxID=3983 RepID=A0A2C9UR20_MANES|nr:zinc finger MYM-type protein 1-like [Manihot esculenta]
MIDKYFTKLPKNSEPLNSKPKEKVAFVEKESLASDDDIIGDPRLRKPIDSYPFEIRDSLRRRYLAKGPCQPVGHKFPFTFIREKNRRFQVAWFKDYEWLEYSVSKDKAYCLYCYLFANNNRSGGNVFTEIGFNNWKDGRRAFVNHEGSPGSSHSGCRMKVEQYRNQRGNVDQLLARQTAAMEDDYRTRLSTVVSVARILLEEGLPFRGHDESAESLHRGNFLEHISWVCKREENVNKVMGKNAPGNNQLTSPTIQRDIIECCAMETRKIILNELGEKKFALLVDEARDCSVKEQMSLVLRFINDKGMVLECFLGLVHVNETSAKVLKNAIDSFFAKHDLSLAKLRGQGYDGAANMSGEFNGLKTLILKENKNAHYIHCFAHQLQLVIVTASHESESVGDFFETLSMIVNTIGASCKRKDSFREIHNEEVLNQVEMGEISTGRGQNQAISLARPELLRCVMCLDPSNSFANFDHVRLLQLAKLYSDDFSSTDIIELDHQLQNYICDMRSNEIFSNISNLGDLAKKMVEINYHTYFPLVYRLIELALILPVGTASVERTFSAMNVVKTDLRNQLGDDLLSDCLVCYFEKEIFRSIDDEVIMQSFQNLASRRNQLRPLKIRRPNPC